MSPLGAVTMAHGPLNVSWAKPATPAFPSRIRIFPSGLNLITCWPLPLAPRASVTHTFPSLSTQRPCGYTKRPAPKFFSIFPLGSNSKIGARSESPHDAAPAGRQLRPARNFVVRIGLGIRQLSFAVDILHIIDCSKLVNVGIRRRRP